MKDKNSKKDKNRTDIDGRADIRGRADAGNIADADNRADAGENSGGNAGETNGAVGGREGGGNNGESKNGGSNASLYMTAAADVLAAVFYGLAFSPIKIYGLIASVLLELAALAFAGSQKKVRPSPALTAATVIAYALLAASAATFIAGMVFSATGASGG